YSQYCSIYSRRCMFTVSTAVFTVNAACLQLKQDDEACVAALQNAQLFLFHRLSPLLQHTEAQKHSWRALEGKYLRKKKESVLIGCSQQNQFQFCLDVGDLNASVLTEACEGKFIELRKSFFLLTGSEAPLLAKAQALLRWHQTSGFSSATGHPTHRNQAGSQRICSCSGIVYYPKMSPVVIVLVSDGNRCLLGRQPSFPRGMYSALAGFCDMGEYSCSCGPAGASLRSRNTHLCDQPVSLFQVRLWRRL
uniref:NADH pyrophosphatase-like N-terminal domain-containing protein n=1 Tax=Mola mola TaxID=94237 RepID=A0A3Q3WC01_MOLML